MQPRRVLACIARDLFVAMKVTQTKKPSRNLVAVANLDRVGNNDPRSENENPQTGPMKLLKLTLETMVGNIALDEALLEAAEADEGSPELLRIWEPQATAVVVGRSSPVEKEVNLEFCQANDIEVFRRCSGGQSIVTGPGCLMYAVVLDYRKRPELRMLEKAHRFVMGQMAAALNSISIDAKLEGTSDLTLGGRKFSGNALRCKRSWLVYHGTMICDFDIDLIAACLGDPIRQPDYRQRRSHQDFLTQLPTSVELLSAAIAEQWNATEQPEHCPSELTDQLVSQKYSQSDWTYKV